MLRLLRRVLKAVVSHARLDQHTEQGSKMSYPAMSIGPGSYNARFYLYGRVLSGIVELEGRKPVRFEVYDPDGISRPSDFPQESQVDRLAGHLWRNEDIILRHVQLSEIFPGRYTGIASYALVGLGIQDIEDRLCSVEFQVEGLDEFFWTKPSKNINGHAVLVQTIFQRR